jgi:hypothetical protein
MAAMTTNGMMTIVAGGRFFLAVPYSSPMLNGVTGAGVTEENGSAGGVEGGVGVSSGIGASCRKILILSGRKSFTEYGKANRA